MPPDAMSTIMLESYVTSVIKLYQGNVAGGGAVQMVAEGFGKSEDLLAFDEHLTSYKKKDSAITHSLSKPPVIVKEASCTKVSANFINSKGGIECWTITITPSDSLTITGITMKELYPSHSFPYPTPDE